MKPLKYILIAFFITSSAFAIENNVNLNGAKLKQDSISLPELNGLAQLFLQRKNKAHFDSDSYNELISYLKDQKSLNIERPNSLISKDKSVNFKGLLELVKYESELLHSWQELDGYSVDRTSYLMNNRKTNNKCGSVDNSSSGLKRQPSHRVPGRKQSLILTNASIQIPINFHLINKESGFMIYDQHGNAKNVNSHHITESIKVLNDAFSDYNISFTHNYTDQWYNSNWNLNGMLSYDSLATYTMLNNCHQDPDLLLNVYIIDGRVENRDTILGEAVFPWDQSSGRFDDYVILDARTLPGFIDSNIELSGMGKTLIHEVGHYLGLYHTHEGGILFDGCYYGDRVADTPSQEIPYWDGLCDIELDTCPENEGKDPINNYMGYNHDICLTEFTQGQIDRIFQAVAFHRPQYLKSLLLSSL